MTYSTGGIIQATDYNTFATTINSVFADPFPGAATLPNAGFGYGQSSVAAVTAGSAITAAQWASLFQAIRKTGAHQGTTTAPPVPVSDPAAGSSIIAYNTPSMTTLLTALATNKFNIAAGQFTATFSPQAQTSGVWLNTLTYNCSVSFGSWNAARYYFNSGGALSVSATYSPVTTVDDANWAAVFSTMGTRSLYHSTNTGTNPSVGFYGLSTTPVAIYTGNGTGAYSASTMIVYAFLNAAAGSATAVNFRIVLTDNDSGSPVFKQNKAGTTTYTMGKTRATGSNVAVADPTVGSVTFVSA